jgi:hypothetical protein
MQISLRQTLTVIAARAFRFGTLAAIVFLPVEGGCVERRLTVRSNPPGALVYVDDYEIGTTPVSTDFTYYGTRKIRLVKDGYETLTVLQPISTPWYEYPPLDFISENFIPGKIRDQRVLDYQLKPQVLVPTDQLVSRAEGLRGAKLVVPPGAALSLPAGVQPVQQPVAPSTLPGTVPSMMPAPNSYPQPNATIPPGAYGQPPSSIPPGPYTQPNTTPAPTMLSPPDIGGQAVPQLPPR